jgi:cobaltochelatase CobS
MTSGSGSEKITCAICKKWEGHVIVKHLKEEHPKVSPFDYITEYDAQIASPHGFEVLRRNQKHAVVERPRSPALISKVFGIAPEKNEKANGPRKFVNRSVLKFDDRVANVPEVDEDYVFPEQALKKLLIGLTLPTRNRVWLKGYSGTGKTQLVCQTAARLNYGLVRVQGDSAVTRRHLVGDWVVRNGETVFQHGVVVEAMRRGDILLIDEIDNLNPAALVILRGVLEDPSSISILENGGEVIKAHPYFRVVATANTAGAGDESGLFVTARALSLADRQRFNIWVNVDYLPANVEVGMVMNRFPELTKDEGNRFYQVVQSIRARHKAGEFEESFSPREFINWVEKFFLTGDAMEAAQMCFLDRYQSPAVAVGVGELVKAAWNPAVPSKELPTEDP